MDSGRVFGFATSSGRGTRLEDLASGSGLCGKSMQPWSSDAMGLVVGVSGADAACSSTGLGGGASSSRTRGAPVNWFSLSEPVDSRPAPATLRGQTILAQTLKSSFIGWIGFFEVDFAVLCGVAIGDGFWRSDMRTMGIASGYKYSVMVAKSRSWP